MNIRALFIGDIRFQFKYGFYFLYLVFSGIYIALLFAVPSEWRENAAILMIFSDPAAMGLYFMGAIVLFEKSERVLDSIAISPIKPLEYVLSKLISIAVISTAVGILIGFGSRSIENVFYMVIGVFLCSCLFSSIGLIIASKIRTLNQFIVSSIPAEILINIPAIAYLFGFKSRWLLLHPGVCMMELCINGQNAFTAMIILALWTVLFTMFANQTVTKMFKSVGGVKL